MIGKLVRDFVPDLIRSKGLEPEIHRAGTEEFRQRLQYKLQEEVDEVLRASDRESLLEELADVLEVLLAMAAELGVDEQGLLGVAESKAKLRGRFTEHLVWTGNHLATGRPIGGVPGDTET